MGGNISRGDSPNSSSNNSRKIKPGFRNNSTAHSTASSAATAAQHQEKKFLLQQQQHQQIQQQQQPRPTKRTIHGRSYHAIETSTYMLPRDDKEIDRLHDEHFITKELLGFNIMVEALKLFDFQSGGLDILDVCCGPATWLCETSLEYPNCHFSGIDMCSLWPEVIRPVNLDFTEANILQGLPYPDKSFDFVQMRNVVLAFKSNEWPFVISEIKRVLKDGGCFQCVEFDMRITTSDTVARNYTETFESFCASFGLDASVGAKLDYLLTNGGNNGMRILQSEYREVPLGWGGPIGDAYIQAFQGLLDGLEPWLKQSLNVTDYQDYNLLMNRTRHSLIHSKSFMGLYAFLVQKPLD